MHRRGFRWLIALACAWIWALPEPGRAQALAEAAASPTPFDPGRAGFSVTVNGAPHDHEIGFAAVMPGETVRILPGWQAGDLRLQHDAGLLREAGAVFEWAAPFKPGHYPLALRRPADGAYMVIHVFVKRPLWYMSRGSMNGYAIGAYPAKAKDNNPIYQAPEGLIEVSAALAGLRISPHFTLGQFLCRQEGRWPKYLLLRPQLVAKLELLLEAINARGIRADSLHVMSGYRTPIYNASIGNVPYSRHLWGGAADIFIDTDGDGVMDDITFDGVSDRRDAAALYDLLDQASRRPPFLSLVGGLGEYGANHAHGPFVHVDVRGARARWGRPRISAAAAR